MKKMMFMAVMMAIATTASAMSYSKARSEAFFLSDKMAYELRLSDRQYDAVYEINLDYFLSVGTARDLFGMAWDRRNSDLQYVLSARQWSKYVTMGYFYRPLAWRNGSLAFEIYARYDRSRFFRAAPKVYVADRGVQNHFDRTRYDRGVQGGTHFGGKAVDVKNRNLNTGANGSFSGRSIANNANAKASRNSQATRSSHFGGR